MEKLLWTIGAVLIFGIVVASTLVCLAHQSLDSCLFLLASCVAGHIYMNKMPTWVRWHK